MEHPARWDFINYLIERNNYKSYLEIGVKHIGINFNRIKAEFKEGVDPEFLALATYHMTSDEFFKSHCNRSYDIIFIDGLHLEEQVLRDVANSIKHLNTNGTIVLHDCSPTQKIHQLPTETFDVIWNGTVWRAFARLRMTRPDLFMCTVDSDHGLGVITAGSQTTYPSSPLSFEFLVSNRASLLNLVKFKQFKTDIAPNIYS